MSPERRGRARHVSRSGTVAFAALMSVLAATDAAAQGNCNVNKSGACQVGGTATFAMNLTISAVVRLTFPSASIALGTATSAEFAAGFGTAISVPVTVQANTGWAIAVSGPVSLWTASPVTARQNKPLGDLQWATAAGGPYSNLSGAPTAIRAGGATALTVFPLFLRSRYAFNLDFPGSYSLPLLFTITAP